MQEILSKTGVDFLLTAIVTIVIFLLMISLHELGHFVAAKLSGVEVREFSIGMGPALFKKQGRETLYSVRLLPIGGYCALEGEDGESENPRAFSNQTLWKRFFVVFSGAAVNIILGFIIFVIIASVSAPFLTNRIKSIDTRSAMYQSGVMAGDKIVKLNGKGISFYRDISLYKSELTGTENVEMTVLRDGEKLTFSFPLSEVQSKIVYTEEGAVETNIIDGIAEVKEYKYKEGFTPTEDIIGKEYTNTSFILGFSPEYRALTPLSLLNEAYCNTKFVVKLVYKSLWDMVTGRAGIEQISGPVGVVDAVNTAVKSDYGLMSVLSLTALLTINLGIFNLLPLPALDGGRLFFMLIELVRGKPVPAEKEGLVHAVGLILLLLLAAVISAKDIYMLFMR